MLHLGRLPSPQTLDEAGAAIPRRKLITKDYNITQTLQLFTSIFWCYQFNKRLSDII
jgi:hypothetical protein